jgi:hypothetical protein
MITKLTILVLLFLAPLFASASTVCSVPFGAFEGLVLFISGFVLLIIRVLYVKEQKDDTDLLN